MQQRPLGRTGLLVSEICLGTMTWGRQNSEAEAFRQIELAADRGVNFMDTAELYATPPSAETYGRTEAIIGNWFGRTGRRDDWILATKFSAGGTPWIRGGSRPTAATIREALEGSLRRLKVDHVDLYQVHTAPRGHYHFEHGWTYAPHAQDREFARAELMEMLQTLGDLVAEGKVRHFGVSNETAWGIAEALRLADRYGLPRIVSVQNEYNLLRRGFDLDLAELSHYEDIGLLAYSPLASGLLSGKYLDGVTPAGTRGDILGQGFWRRSEWSEPATAAYVALAREHGLDPAQMAIAFCLTRPFMCSVIIGATAEAQLEADIGAAELRLSPEVLEGIEAIHRRYPRPI